MPANNFCLFEHRYHSELEIEKRNWPEYFGPCQFSTRNQPTWNHQKTLFRFIACGLEKGILQKLIFHNLLCYRKTSDKLGLLATCIYPLSVGQVWHAKQEATLVGSFWGGFPLCCQGHFAHTRSPQNRCGELVNTYFSPLEGWWAFYIVCWWILGSSKSSTSLVTYKDIFLNQLGCLPTSFGKLPQQTGHGTPFQKGKFSTLILGTNLGFAKLLLNSKRKL